MDINIDGRKIGPQQPCFIIAEAGVNHNGDINLAYQLVDAACEAGVDAVKFQTFKAERIVTPQTEQARYQTQNTGKKESQYDMLKRLEISYADFHRLGKYCQAKGIVFLSTPHSCKEDVDLIADLCPALKVGSGDLTNLPLLQYMAGKKVPIILATGMSTMEEVREAVEIILPFNGKLILLHATTNYPTPLEEVNLQAMVSLAKEFNLPVGYSDHTLGIDVPVAAVALGACVIEKHFTLDRNMEGPDHKASLGPGELKKMVEMIRQVEREKTKVEEIISRLKLAAALGDGIKRPMPSEYETMKVVRKSLVARTTIQKWEKITAEMIDIKRPGLGIKPKHLSELIGKIAKERIEENELISWGKIK